MTSGRRLAVYIEPADAWIGAYRSDRAVYWCPLPFLVVRWAGHPRGPGAALTFAGLLSPCTGWSWPVCLVLLVWLALPGAAMLGWAYQQGPPR